MRVVRAAPCHEKAVWHRACLGDTATVWPAPPVRESLMSVHRNAKLDEPREFAGYDLVHCLGRGGQAEVWSVVRRGLYDITRALAIKAMLPELSDNEQYCEIFVTEGRIAMQLSSANIVPVFELGRHDGLLFMVMQRIDGVNLAELQRRTRNVYNTLPLDVVLYIMGEILAALFVAHEHTVAGQAAGVIHRDVKPANILVSSSGDVRLTDFGIARPVSPHSLRAIPIGTLRYISREQAEGSIDRTSDLFSAGAILHELLSGRQFREGAQTEEQLYAAIFKYKEIPELGRVIPEDIERLRRGLLHPDPQRRFQTAAEAMDALSECVGYHYARLKLARIYETSIGMRSSGFTDSHAEAKPSILLSRRSRPMGLGASARRSFVYNRTGTGRETSFRVDEDADTSLHAPRLARDTAAEGEPADEPTSLYRPVLARGRWEAGPHRAAITHGEAAEVRAITPTLQLLLPVGHEREQREGASAPDPTTTSPPPPSMWPTASTSVARDTATEPPGVDGATRQEPDGSDSRNVASISGTIDARDRLPEASHDRSPRTRPSHPSGVPSPLYFMILAALLCALLGVSIAWFLDSRSTARTEAEP
jgi:serine/threonine protein kinase